MILKIICALFIDIATLALMAVLIYLITHWDELETENDSNYIKSDTQTCTQAQDADKPTKPTNAIDEREAEKRIRLAEYYFG